MPLSSGSSVRRTRFVGCARSSPGQRYKDEVKLGGPQPQLPRLELAGVLSPCTTPRGRLRGGVATRARRRAERTGETAARAFPRRGGVPRLWLRPARTQSPRHPRRRKDTILLKDTWVDSFSKADRSFMRAFWETQMFDWYVDVQPRA